MSGPVKFIVIAALAAAVGFGGYYMKDSIGPAGVQAGFIYQGNYCKTRYACCKNWNFGKTQCKKWSYCYKDCNKQ